MISYANILLDSHKNLHYMNAHKSVFEVEDLYPLDIFESFVQAQTESAMDCACKIDKDKLYPARFSLVFYNKQYAEHQVNAAIDFFQQVEGRVGVKLNYQLLQQFLGTGFDFTKVIRNLVGVDARKELADSRVKLFIWIDNYPEKMERAIALCDSNKDLPMLLVNNQLLVGFDFFLDGRSAIELYPTLSSEELRRVDVQQRLAKVLSPPALRLLDQSRALQIGFSEANEGKILYYHVLNPNNFIDNLGNEMASRVHAYYRHQPVRGLVVCIPESELIAGSIQKLNMYYSMNWLSGWGTSISFCKP